LWFVPSPSSSKLRPRATDLYFAEVKAALQGIRVLVPSVSVEVCRAGPLREFKLLGYREQPLQVVEHPSEKVFKEWWAAFSPSLGPRAAAHDSTAPVVWLNGKDVSLERSK
jgi:hypothetical protein